MKYGGELCGRWQRGTWFERIGDESGEGGKEVSHLDFDRFS
jgi:hypothetical protein